MVLDAEGWIIVWLIGLVVNGMRLEFLVLDGLW